MTETCVPPRGRGGAIGHPYRTRELDAQPAGRVPTRGAGSMASESALELVAKPQLFLHYTALALRHRLLQRLNEGTQLGMALEGFTTADLAYRPQAVSK